MAATTFDRFGVRQPTPRRQLVTVAELEELYGPDATVEVSSGGPRARQVVDDDGEDDNGGEYRVVPRRRFNPWVVAVLAVMLGAGGLLVYGLHRTGQLTIPSKLGVGGRALGQTEEISAQRDWWQPMLTTARVTPASGSGALPPAQALQAAEPPEVAEPLAPVAPVAPRAPIKAPAAAEERSASGGETRTSAEIASDQAATDEMLKREAAKAREPSERAPAPQKEDYPPGYIEAESPAKP